MQLRKLFLFPTIVAREIREDVRQNVTLRLLGLYFQYGESNSAGRWCEDEIARIAGVNEMRDDLEHESSAESLGDTSDFVPSGPGGQRALSRRAAFRRAAFHYQVLIHALIIR
ncbi:hypothetical protein FGB62_201g010 [Gracilaria domingensis]|nr:hypothetical protein FGB62_201g010 [Gracilaria domingensis]